jgi:nucleoside-diphosphate-sugar epimerase
VNVFVTGGTGFVGSHLVNALRARRDTITCLVRRPTLVKPLGWGSEVRLVQGDLDNEAALRDACTGADVVFHVAGKIVARSAAEFMATNRDGTANVLEAARDAGVGRFVLVSSLAVAGPTTPGHPVDESRPPAPVTDYGRSKLAAEVLVRAMPSTMAWTIIRPPVVYGEWDRGTLKIFQLARLGVVPVFGDGSQELSVIHAEDLARGLIAAATAPAAAGRLYFAAHPTITTSRGLVIAAARGLGSGPRRHAPRIVPVPPALARGVLWAAGTLAHLMGRATLLSADKGNEYLAPAWTCRSDALTRDTGWHAEIELDVGLRRAADWYREVGWL